MSKIPFTRLSNEEDENELDSVNVSTDDNRGLYLSGAGQSRRRTDYVLVYETCQENESTDEEPAAEAARLASLRTTFQKHLERQGLILQRQTRVVQMVKQHVYLLLRHFCYKLVLFDVHISISYMLKFYHEYSNVFFDYISAQFLHGVLQHRRNEMQSCLCNKLTTPSQCSNGINYEPEDLKY